MSSEIPINDKLRSELKIPLGRLLPDAEITKETLTHYFAGKTATVSVGDRTTERMQEFGLSPSLEIVDSLEKRVSRKAPDLVDSDRVVLAASNPPGYISSDALEKLSSCLQLVNSHKLARLLIRGEEDLLVLPIAAFFAPGTTIFYGQPNEGMVVVFSQNAGGRAREILREMGITSLDSLAGKND